MNTFALAALALFAPSSEAEAQDDFVAIAGEYRQCIEQFAFKQIRSGEDAATLVRVGEVECKTLLMNIRDVARQQILARSDIQDAYRDLPRTDVDQLVRASTEELVELARDSAVSAALRNVVFLKARINEIERQGANPNDQP